MENETKGLIGGYNQRDFEAGPKTYRDTTFLNLIEQSTGLPNFESKKLLIADIMSGSGGVGLPLLKKYPQHSYIFLDLARRQLFKINDPNTPILKIQADARQAPFSDGVFDLEVARYAVKDLTETDQQRALLEVYRTLKPGGSFTLADMLAPNKETKSWLNKQHARKQEFTGRDSTTEGVCHIATESEWVSLIESVGFSVSIVGKHVSKVTTSDWEKGKQVSKEQLHELNTMILNAPKKAKSALNIRLEGDEVKIDYPIIVIRGIK